MGDSVTRQGRRAWFRLISALFGATVVAAALSFAATPHAQVGETAGVAKQVRFELNQFLPEGVMMLRGAAASRTIDIPVPDRWDVRGATLRFSYVNSTGLLAHRSQLTVRLNGRVAAQVALLPESPEGRVEAVLDPRLLRPGYNALEFAVAQNYTETCSDPSDPTLWTMIELERSMLDLEYRMLPVPESLSAVAKMLFDPKQVGPNRVHLVVPDTSLEMIHLAAIVASGAALRFDFRPVRFSISSRMDPQSKNILLGNRAFVAAAMNSTVEDMPSGNLGVVGLRDQEGVPTRAAVVVTGDDASEMLLAAQGFSALSFPLPEAGSATVRSVTFPDRVNYPGKGLLLPGTATTFAEMGFASRTYRGMGPGSESIVFRIPTDMHMPTNEFAVMKLHVAHAARMRTDSALNIALNDTFVSSIPLQDEMGGYYQGYTVRIPWRLFRRGENRLTLTPTLTPLVTGDCQLIQTEHLAVTLFDDSTLELPAVPRWVEMPEMRYFFEDGFPFARDGNWNEAMILLADTDQRTAAAAVNLVAMVAQRSGVVPTDLRFISEWTPGHGDRDMIVVGPIAAVPEQLRTASPLEPELAYPLSRLIRWVPGEARNIWLRMRNLVAAPHIMQPEENSQALVEMDLSLASGTALLMTYRAPESAQRSVMALTGARSHDVIEGAWALWDDMVRWTVSGNVALLDLRGPEPLATTQQVGPRYHVGKLGRFPGIHGLINAHPLAFLGGVVAFVLLFGLLLRALLRRRRAARLVARQAD